MGGEITIWIIGTLILGLAAWGMLRAFKKRRPVTKVSEEAPLFLVPKADALILGDIDNPLLEVTPLEAASASPCCVEIDPGIRHALQPLLQRAPELLRVGKDIGVKSFRLVFSPEVTRGLNKGTLELAPSAGELLPVVRKVGGSKKFLKLGRAVATGCVRLANVAAATWQIAAIAAAQHFLTEINARLAGIERGIDDIRAWLEAEKKAELSAAVGLLKEYYNAIARGKLHDLEQASIYYQLDDIERTCCSIAELAREVSSLRLEELGRLEIKEWLDRGGSAVRANKWIRQNREAIELIFLAQSTRILACLVKSTLPGDRQRLVERIKHATAQFAEAQKLFDETEDAFQSKVRELRKRGGNPLALLDKDLRSGIVEQFATTREQLVQANKKLSRESSHAIDFAGRFQELDKSGVRLDVRYAESGELEILEVETNTP